MKLLPLTYTEATKIGNGKTINPLDRWKICGGCSKIAQIWNIPK